MIFSGKHKVLTKEGYKTIETLKVGDGILTDEGINKIIKIIEPKKKKVNIIGELKNGVVTLK